MERLILVASLLALTSAQGVPVPQLRPFPAPLVEEGDATPVPIAVPDILPKLEVEEAPPTPPPNATYWLSMSNKLRPGNPFRVSGQILKGQSPVTVQFTFMDSKGEKTLLEPAPVTMTPGDVQTFQFEIPLDIPQPTESDGNQYWYYNSAYSVHVSGIGEEVKFKHKTNVQYEQKTFSTFIQTDKGMYKPGQKVFFRVLTVFPDMTAVRGETYDVYIEDAKENRIRQWLDVKDPNGRGVVELSLQLADEVPTGDWTIHATILGKEETKTFTVDNYVLPRFEVEVIAPSFGLTYHAWLNLTVKATYTFGQPVTEGYAVVKIQGHHWSANRQAAVYKRGLLTKDGTAEVQMTTKEILDTLKGDRTYITSLSNWPISVTAEVTEKQTGRAQASDPVIIKYHDQEMKVRFVEEVAPKSFKPGLPFLIYAEVTKQDDSVYGQPNDIKVYFNVTYEIPLTEEEQAELNQKRKEEAEKMLAEAAAKQGEARDVPSVDIGISRPAVGIIGGGLYNYPETKTVMLKLAESQRIQDLPANGWVPLTFDTPFNATSMSVEVWVMAPDGQRISWSKWLQPAKSPTDSFMQLLVGTEKPTVGQAFPVRVKSTDMMKEITYQVYAKGILLESTVVTAPADPTDTLDFSLMVTREMAPSISLMAFYVRDENKEVVVDAMSLSVNGLFDKPMTVAFTQDTAEPGDKLEVIVKAETDSTVYLLSADKSAVLLKGGNDITQDDVTEDMAEYTVGSGFGAWRFMFICGMPSPFGGSTAQNVFDNAGVLFLSDVLVYVHHGNRDGSTWDKVPVAIADGGIAENAGAESPKTDPGLAAADVVRKFFPEVWLWEISYITDDSGGQVSIPVTVPDTLTSWMTTGFSLHPEFGLSVVEEPTVLVVSRDLFVTLDLPMSLIRGEDYCFTATVFSYYKGSIPVLVTLERSDKFNNTHVKLDGNMVKLSKESVSYSHFLGDMMENEVRAVKYCFSPLDIGEIPVRVNVTTNIPGLSDAVERIVVSKPEGVPRATTLAFIADLSSTGQWNKDVDIWIPENTVDGSQSITVSTSGNFLGSMFDNLGDLLKKPYGCGEQNMLNFAPNIFLLEFYMSTDNLPGEIKKTAVRYMLDGYQRQNNYRHMNGGYSTFGSWESKDPASTWLTAFVVKCYSLAQQLYMKDSDLVAIDPKIMAGALTFLASTLQKDGSFVENGKIFHKEMQGASAEKGVSLTAYTVIAMHEAMLAFNGSKVVERNMEEFIEPIMTQTLTYLESKVGRLSDPYDICLVAYALALVDSPLAQRAFEEMERAAKVDGNVKYWERSTPVVKPHRSWSTNTASINIEMTAYALLVYSLRPGATEAGLPVLRWLTQNKGPNAGFYSTQDTVIGLQALSRVGSELYTGEDIPVTVTINYKNDLGVEEGHVFNLDKSNELLLQSAKVPVVSTTRVPLVLRAQTVSGQSGPTTAIVEATLRFNVLGTEASDKFILRYSLDETDPSPGFTLKISIAAPEGESRSMSVMEVEIPPGYTPDLEELRAVSDINRVEMKEEKLALYFNTDIINDRGVKFSIRVYRSGTGTLTKPQKRTIRVYDYYERNDEVSQEYILQGIGDSGFCTALPDVGVCSIVELRKNNLE